MTNIINIFAILIAHISQTIPIIALAPNLFFGTTIAVTILVLAKNKQNTDVQFIDASGEAFFRKSTNTNLMEDRHIDEVLRLFASKEAVPHVAQNIAQQMTMDNDYSLSVSAYVAPKDTRGVTDIVTLNGDIATTVARITDLRAQIDAIVAEIEA